MSGYAVKSQAGDATSFVESLGAYSRQHRAKHWAGTFEEFLVKRGLREERSE